VGRPGKRLSALEGEIGEYLDLEEKGQGKSLPYELRIYRLWKRWGISPLELISWPSWLVDAMMTCDAATKAREIIPLPGASPP
jgi:hypothetical protein